MPQNMSQASNFSCNLPKEMIIAMRLSLAFHQVSRELLNLLAILKLLFPAQYLLREEVAIPILLLEEKLMKQFCEQNVPAAFSEKDEPSSSSSE